MGFTIVAVVVGLVVGLALGGRPRHLGERPFRAWPLLAAGLVVQAISTQVGGGAGFALLLASYVLLVAFAAANAHIVGMVLIGLGLGLNALTIAVNHGMPVRTSAIVAAHIAKPGEDVGLDGRGKRHLERRSDRLMPISDIIPVRELRQVLSFGDLVLSVGVADVMVHLLKPPRRGGAHLSRPRRTPRGGPATG